VKRSDPDVVQLSNRLAETFGAKVEIRHSRRGAGKLVISYANLDHLQGIIDRLTVSAPAVDLYGTH
jgi:ParB family chromosome partitioning protein